MEMSKISPRHRGSERLHNYCEVWFCWPILACSHLVDVVKTCKNKHVDLFAGSLII